MSVPVAPDNEGFAGRVSKMKVRVREKPGPVGAGVTRAAEAAAAAKG